MVVSLDVKAAPENDGCVSTIGTNSCYSYVTPWFLVVKYYLVLIIFFKYTNIFIAKI